VFLASSNTTPVFLCGFFFFFFWVYFITPTTHKKKNSGPTKKKNNKGYLWSATPLHMDPISLGTVAAVALGAGAVVAGAVVTAGGYAVYRMFAAVRNGQGMSCCRTGRPSQLGAERHDLVDGTTTTAPCGSGAVLRLVPCAYDHDGDGDGDGARPLLPTVAPSAAPTMPTMPLPSPSILPLQHTDVSLDDWDRSLGSCPEWTARDGDVGSGGGRGLSLEEYIESFHTTDDVWGHSANNGGPTAETLAPWLPTMPRMPLRHRATTNAASSWGPSGW